jgi:hypothetical protein
MEPFVALMRRYCIDYTNSHDQSVCKQVMAPEYIVHMGGNIYRRDEDYIPGVRQLLDECPGLGLLVHEFVTNGERLAMRFSEHTAEPGGELTCWSGIGVYRWNGEQLLENWVEQDYEARQEQIRSGTPQALEPPHIDPWTSTRAVPADAGAEQIARAWLHKGDFRSASDVVIDDSRNQGLGPPLLDVESVTINDLFSAGSRLAFHVTQRGSYRGGLAGVDQGLGRPVTLHCAGLARLEGDSVAAAHVVTGRFELRAQLLE